MKLNIYKQHKRDLILQQLDDELDCFPAADNKIVLRFYINKVPVNEKNVDEGLALAGTWLANLVEEKSGTTSEDVSLLIEETKGKKRWCIELLFNEEERSKIDRAGKDICETIEKQRAISRN